MARERKPVEPVSQERRERLRALPGTIILARGPGANAWQGYVEHSFSMGWSDSAANFWAVGCGSDHHLAATRRDHPDWDIQEFDAHAEDLPVVLDWESWIDAQAYDPNTLSGVTDKYKARNIPFVMRDE